jgi:hypothetical protein
MTFHQLLARRSIAFGLAAITSATICLTFGVGWLFLFSSVATVAGMVAVDVARYGFEAFKKNPVVRAAED